MKKGHTLFKPLLDEIATPENMLFPSRFLDKPHREQVKPMPEPTATDPIAIIGIGCHLPGGATNALTFWQMFMGGVDASCHPPGPD